MNVSLDYNPLGWKWKGLFLGCLEKTAIMQN